MWHTHKLEQHTQQHPQTMTFSDGCVQKAEGSTLSKCPVRGQQVPYAVVNAKTGICYYCLTALPKNVGPLTQAHNGREDTVVHAQYWMNVKDLATHDEAGCEPRKRIPPSCFQSKFVTLPCYESLLPSIQSSHCRHRLTRIRHASVCAASPPERDSNGNTTTACPLRI